jgi:hypothetical protein
MLRVYIVAHVKTYPEFADEADDRFRWYVANKAIQPKDIHVSGEKRVNEWELDWYEPGMQANNFREISALLHVLRNPSLSDFHYIGFAQYDMKIPSNVLDAFESAPGDDKLGVGEWYPKSDVHVRPGSLSLEFWELMVDEAFPGTAWSDLGRIPLCTTFIASRGTLKSLLIFLDEMVAHVARALRGDVTHLAGNLERVVGVWLAGAIASKKITNVVYLGIDHVRTSTIV